MEHVAKLRNWNLDRKKGFVEGNVYDEQRTPTRWDPDDYITVIGITSIVDCGPYLVLEQTIGGSLPGTVPEIRNWICFHVDEAKESK